MTRRRAELYPKRPELPLEGNSWEVRHRKAELCLIPWIERTYPLRGRTVLEYGCGSGAVSCALGPRVERHIGVDINANDVRFGQQRAEELGLVNVELHYIPVDQITEMTAEFAGEIDVFLFYAVLEHMTIAERLEILELARRAVRLGGVIVVCELPNRLIAQDHHTSQLPFFAQLPDELALEYFNRSERPDFVEGMREATSAGLERAGEALARWGRGASYHEFEVVFGDLSHRVIASNYDEVLMPVREVHREELTLAALLSECRPDLAPSWSRYWQDVILSVEPVVLRPKLIRPWTMETSHSPGVAWTRAGTLELVEDAELHIPLPTATTRLLIGVATSFSDITLEVEGKEDIVSIALPIWRHITSPRYVTIELAAASSELRIRFSCAGNLVFLGYEA